MKHHEEEQIGEARHEFKLSADKTQGEQEFQAEQNLDDLEYFESNKNEVMFKIVST